MKTKYVQHVTPKFLCWGCGNGLPLPHREFHIYGCSFHLSSFRRAMLTLAGEENVTFEEVALA